MRSLIQFLQEAQFISNPQLIPLCGRIFKLNREQENRLCILLLRSNLPHIRLQAASLIKQKFGDILKSYCDADERLLQDTDKTVFHELLLLLEPGQREEFAERVTNEQEEEFRSTLKRLYPHARHIPLQLKPLLSRYEINFLLKKWLFVLWKIDFSSHRNSCNVTVESTFAEFIHG